MKTATRKLDELLSQTEAKINKEEAEGRRRNAELLRINAIQTLTSILEKVENQESRFFKKGYNWLIKQIKKIDLEVLKEKMYEDSNYDGNHNGEIDVTGLKYIPKRDTSDLFGLDEQIGDIKSIIKGYFDHGPESDNPLPGIGSDKSNICNLLLVGPPGTGKSHVAEAIAKELSEEMDIEVSFIPLQGYDIKHSEYGKSEKFLAEVLNAANNGGLGIVFIDEIEEIASRADHEATAAIANTLAGLTDGVRAVKNVVVIGATNRLDKVDDAIKSRFELIDFPLPDRETRRKIFMLAMQECEGSLDFNPERLSEWFAGNTEGLSGREIKRCIRRASIEAIKRSKGDKVRLTERDLGVALEKIKNAHPHISSDCKNRATEYRGEHRLRCN